MHECFFNLAEALTITYFEIPFSFFYYLLCVEPVDSFTALHPGTGNSSLGSHLPGDAFLPGPEP